MLLSLFSLSSLRLTVVAVWGLPGHTHYDDCFRATAAAMELCNRAQCVLSVNCSVGVATGPSYYCCIGSRTRSAMTLTSMVVAHALKIQQLAAKANIDVMVDRHTQTRVANQNKLAFKEVSGHLLGKHRTDKLAPFFRPISSSLLFSQLTESAFVGRTKEISVILNLAHSVKNNEPFQPLVLQAATGYGGSHFLETCAHRVDELGLKVLRVGASLEEGQNDFAICRPLLEQLLLCCDSTASCTSPPPATSSGITTCNLATQLTTTGVTTSTSTSTNTPRGEAAASSLPATAATASPVAEDNDTAVLVERLLAVLPLWGMELLPLLNPILGCSLRETAPSRALSPAARRQRTCELMAFIVGSALADSQAFLFVDDGHRFDEHSLTLLSYIVRHVNNCALLLAWDTSRPSTRLKAWKAEVNAQVMAIGAFSNQEAAEFMRRLVMVQSVHPTASDLLLSCVPTRHPLALREGIDMLLRACLIASDGFSCTLARKKKENPFAIFQDKTEEARSLQLDHTPQWETLPELALAISHLYNTLTPNQQLVAKSASVIGLQFNLEALIAINPSEAMRAQVHENILGIVRVGILRVDDRHVPPLQAQHFSFRNVALQQVIYRSLTLTHRGEIHKRLARWYSQKYAANLELLHPLLHYHWAAGGEMDKMRRYAPPLDRMTTLPKNGQAIAASRAHELPFGETVLQERLVMSPRHRLGSAFTPGMASQAQQQHGVASASRTPRHLASASVGRTPSFFGPLTLDDDDGGDSTGAGATARGTTSPARVPVSASHSRTDALSSERKLQADAVGGGVSPPRSRRTLPDLPSNRQRGRPSTSAHQPSQGRYSKDRDHDASKGIAHAHRPPASASAKQSGSSRHRAHTAGGSGGDLGETSGVGNSNSRDWVSTESSGLFGSPPRKSPHPSPYSTTPPTLRFFAGAAPPHHHRHHHRHRHRRSQAGDPQGDLSVETAPPPSRRPHTSAPTSSGHASSPHDGRALPPTPPTSASQCSAPSPRTSGARYSHNGVAVPPIARRSSCEVAAASREDAGGGASEGEAADAEAYHRPATSSVGSLSGAFTDRGPRRRPLTTSTSVDEFSMRSPQSSRDDAFSFYRDGHTTRSLDFGSTLTPSLFDDSLPRLSVQATRPFRCLRCPDSTQPRTHCRHHPHGLEDTSVDPETAVCFHDRQSLERSRIERLKRSINVYTTREDHSAVQRPLARKLRSYAKTGAVSAQALQELTAAVPGSLRFHYEQRNTDRYRRRRAESTHQAEAARLEAQTGKLESQRTRFLNTLSARIAEDSEYTTDCDFESPSPRDQL